MVDIVERLRAACDRTDKPSGVHMIDGQRRLVAHFREHWADDEDAQGVAEVADCMAHCIENEALLFECLKTEALEAATTIERYREALEAILKVRVNGWDNIWAGSTKCQGIARQALSHAPEGQPGDGK